MNFICKQCGGLLALWANPEIPLCSCSSKPKHDGNLSSDGGRVSYDQLVEHGIRIEGRYYDGYHDNAVLMPKEALSLLAWLEQERETLEQKAKENTNA